MRLSSLFAPLRQSLARLLPAQFAKSAPKYELRPLTDFFVVTAPKSALQSGKKAELKPFTDFFKVLPRAVDVQRAQTLGLAERRHIRAKYALSKADLTLHQAKRKHGPGSPQAARAAAAFARANVNLGAAAGSLYASRILLGEEV